ncbi:MAG: ankyrin repeat domain-containing protein [Sulfobacillus sp.]
MTDRLRETWPTGFYAPLRVAFLRTAGGSWPVAGTPGGNPGPEWSAIIKKREGIAMSQRGGVGAVLILALMAGCAPPFMRGVASGHVAADVNARANNGNTPLMVAAQGGQTAVAAVLLVHGADVNAKDKLGGTPLMFAARYGHTAVAALLLAHGADVNAQANDGMTPLQAADHIADPNKKQAMIILLQNPATAGERQQDALPQRGTGSAVRATTPAVP